MWILLHISAPVCRWCEWIDERWQPLLHSGYRWDKYHSCSNLHNDVEQKEALGHINSFSESFISMWFYILAFLVLHTIDSRIKVIWNKMWAGWEIIIWLIILKTHTHMILLIWTTAFLYTSTNKTTKIWNLWDKLIKSYSCCYKRERSPANTFFCFYINRAETREPSRVVSMATTQSVVNKVFF